MSRAAVEALLEPKLVGKVSGRFYVRAYQRGYRWGRDEVRKLLDDIWESRDRTYYLQPIVVKRLANDADHDWELVDGQQRLTTLFLIFQYMENKGLKNVAANYSIRYETRPDSAEYLTSLYEERSQERSQKNIDFFHIYDAYRSIGSWFKELGEDLQYVADKLYIALFEHVKVIWYEAPEDVDATTLFTRLNVGRIPLTDAELVKALLLTKIRDLPGTTNRALETAVEWDAIERDLRDPELWAFITGQSGDIPTHISLLLDTLAGGPTGRERPLFHTFETLREPITGDPQAFWKQVVDLHSMVIWGGTTAATCFTRSASLSQSGR